MGVCTYVCALQSKNLAKQWVNEPVQYMDLVSMNRCVINLLSKTCHVQKINVHVRKKLKVGIGRQKHPEENVLGTHCK